MKRISLFIILMILLLYADTSACVTFVVNSKDSLVFGWNYEFDCGSGFLIINKRGLIKKSFVPQNEKPIEWISKYGSLTFNQWGKEFPAGGINEKGLVVVQTMYLKTQFPNEDNRPVISELQWIQYQLDNFSKVQEVIESDKILRISNNSVPLHYMICDKEGNIAIIEFIDHKMVFYMNSEMYYPVMGNDSYQASLAEVKKYAGFGGSKTIPLSSTGPKCGNFIIASDFVKNYDKQKNIIDYSYDILSHSSEPKRTQWSIVFDIRNNKVNFKSLNDTNIKTVSLNDFNYDCNSTVRIIDISAKTTADFVDYTQKINEDCIYKAYNDPAIPWIKEMIPVEINNYKIQYTKTIKCSEK
jgi:penicillin V acylase-like amidase (Ntn superfamily)